LENKSGSQPRNIQKLLNLGMGNLNGDTFGMMMLGTLVKNEEGLIEIVRSMSFTRINRLRSFGPKFMGEINGKPIDKYYDLQITVPLLEALGWSIDEGEMKNVVVAIPPKAQFANRSEAESFKVYFTLEDNAIEKWPKNYSLVNDFGTCYVPVGDFVSLELHFIQMYSQRMDIYFATDDFKVV
jgi:hypothetical protein